MTRILFSEAAFERLQPRLGALARRLDCVVMDRGGHLRRDGREISPGEAAPECAFVSSDLFADALTGRFLELLLRSPALQWVQSGGAGVDHPLFVALAEKGVRVTTSHAQAVGMAEYVMWGVLDHFRSGRAQAAEQAARRWTRRRAREVAGTRWLIIGFGAVGEAVARRAKGFDAHVTGVRRRSGDSPFADAIASPDRLAEHLGDSDVVVLCVPHTPQTTRLVDARFLAAMKPDSVLINVGRGSLVDEDALLSALDAGRPGHAVLDVFRVEPLPADSPLWDHPRVTVTPHGSGASSGAEARTDALLLDNIARYLARRTLLHEVPAAEVLAASAGA